MVHLQSVQFNYTTMSEETISTEVLSRVREGNRVKFLIMGI